MTDLFLLVSWWFLTGTRPPNPPDYHHAMQSRLVALKSASLPPEHIVRAAAVAAAARQSQSPSLASRSEDELSAGSANR